MVGFIGPWEFGLLVLLILFFFGTRRFSAAGKSLARGAKEFKRSVTEKDQKELEPPEEQKTA